MANTVSCSHMFSGISQESYSRMMSCFNSAPKKYSAGETICFYEPKKRTVGIIEKGRAVVVKTFYSGSQTILEQLSDGSIFGEVFYFHANTDGISVIPASECTVRFIDYEHIMTSCHNACQHHSQLIQNLFSIISCKAAELSEHIDVLSHRTIREKLMAYFQIQSSKNNSTKFKLPFSLSALADYISVDRSAMMREIKKIKEEGYIDISQKEVTLLKEYIQ